MRSIAVVAGMSWIEAVLTTTNIAISFVAAPSARCSLAISHIARMPSGVAALPRPRKFAMRFMVMAFTASPLGRRPLKRRFVIGESRRESNSVRPRLLCNLHKPAPQTEHPGEGEHQRDRLSRLPHGGFGKLGHPAGQRGENEGKENDSCKNDVHHTRTPPIGSVYVYYTVYSFMFRYS